MLAAEEHFADTGVRAKSGLLVEKQTMQGTRHANQHGDALVDDQLGDFAEVIVLGRAHGEMCDAHLFQYFGKTEEPSVQVAAVKQVHDPVL